MILHNHQVHLDDQIHKDCQIHQIDKYRQIHQIHQSRLCDPNRVDCFPDLTKTFENMRGKI